MKAVRLQAWETGKNASESPWLQCLFSLKRKSRWYSDWYPKNRLAWSVAMFWFEKWRVRSVLHDVFKSQSFEAHDRLCLWRTISLMLIFFVSTEEREEWQLLRSLQLCFTTVATASHAWLWSWTRPERLISATHQRACARQHDDKLLKMIANLCVKGFWKLN